MKAFVIDRYKGPVHAAEVPTPTLGPRDIYVKVIAASVNPLDQLVRSGEFKQLLKYPMPVILGHDVSGVVTDIGAEVTDFAIGDEIYARPRDLRVGTFAEYIAIHQDDAAHKPKTLSFEEAAAVPLVALAAWQMLVEKAHIRPGQKVLVHAGAGGLGSTVIQLAKHLGAHVATTAGSASTDLVTSLGADVVIDYRTTDFADVLSGYDLAIDAVGGDNLMKTLTVLAPGGLAVGVTGPPDAGFATQLGAPAPFKVILSLLSRKVRAAAKKRGVRYSFFFTQSSGEQLRTLAALYDAGHLRPVIDSTFPFDKTVEALTYVEAGKTKAGKVVITHN
ncbi:NADP-dependent oxidoreductase [Williamsia soli]|uniref:NADP-dependent oxidoreductase n=1 Tax=Williamsia soli TaxID=364929 RepID=UPI001A9D1827|nr:NADP-dependent oxidoreductase [Williamsia soli]